MSLDRIKELVEELTAKSENMKAELETATEKGFAYARSKNIRKYAQEAKLAAQNIRIACSQLFKAEKDKE
jgi:hypothetical protein